MPYFGISEPHIASYRIASQFNMVILFVCFAVFLSGVGLIEWWPRACLCVC